VWWSQWYFLKSKDYAVRMLHTLTVMDGQTALPRLLLAINTAWMSVWLTLTVYEFVKHNHTEITYIR